MTEALKVFKCSSIPNKCLKLEIGSPIMLSINLKEEDLGSRNGTHIIVKKLGWRHQR